MKKILKDILHSIHKSEKLLAVLIDPDKVDVTYLPNFIRDINKSMATHIFVGGSLVKKKDSEKVVSEIKKHTQLPIILFPGDITQITDEADAILFLSLISGRNPDYLIGKHVQSISNLKGTNLEVIPTGYILIENGNVTSVERVTNTTPIPRKNSKEIVDTALAGELLGLQLIYLEAGSGASQPVPSEIIKAVKKSIRIPLIVGGGIRSKEQLDNAYNSGADLVA
ncbi:MAG: geranylgeranylglyceryl/heptaprenylglyceryl phosphate synthase, partial [Bacteroidia bacterium]|nr:geranylgeranylglyceryl/heptaprenylglyceryl phosphate synthase [Bacteroidia bacterium]